MAEEANPTPKTTEKEKEEAAPAPPPGKVRFRLNGREVETEAGTTIIRAALDHGVHIPYFCWHPGLTPEGNCRMCLVEVAGSRKPIPACTTPVTEGMEVLTESPAAKDARADVLEFMLVNHPLDCPICDKSGECLLQDHAYAHGKDRSRMVEPKELKPTKDLGAGILLWGNRCIVCTRCVRFCHEIAGTGELTIVNRGDRAVVDVFPDYPLFNPLAGNVVDICPVGALISKDFLYQARVWFEKKTESVCVACARGCNVQVETLSNKVKRLVPRHNPDVNDYWMCDYGRYDHHYILGPKRMLRYRTDGAPPLTAEDAGGRLASQLERVAREYGGEAVGAFASAFMTCETLYLLRELLEALGAPRQNIAALARPDGKEETFKSGFRISRDKNPNRNGVRLLLGEEAFEERREALLEGARSGKIRALAVFADMPHHPLDPDLKALLEKIDFACVFLLEKDPELPAAPWLYPATAFSERDGTVINEDGRIQLLRAATALPRSIASEFEVLQGALMALGKRARILSAQAVFSELAGKVEAFAGLDYPRIGRLGVPLEAAAAVRREEGAP